MITNEIKTSQKVLLQTLNDANKYHSQKSVNELLTKAVSSARTFQEAIDYLVEMKREVHFRTYQYPYVDVENTIDKAIVKLQQEASAQRMSKLTGELIATENSTKETERVDGGESLDLSERKHHPYYLSPEQKQTLVTRLLSHLKEADTSALEVVEILREVEKTFFERSWHITSNKKAD